MPALTRAEAVERHRLLDVTSYDVQLDLADAGTGDDFRSTVTIRFSCDDPGASTFADLKAGALVSARLNGVSLPDAAWAEGRLSLTSLQAVNVLTVEARFPYSRTGEGLHRFVDPEDGCVYLYSQAFLDDCPRVFACFDQPDLKATFTVSVEAPAGWTVLGNSPGQCVSPGRWEFATTPPISTYLAAVVAGDYEGVRACHDGIEIGVWCRRSMRAFLDPDRLLDTTRKGLDYFHGLFGVRYPFGKYDQVMVPEFNAGAMENPGLVTFRDEYYLPRGTVTDEDRELVAATQLHELAHMWFGNLVTMRWWDDLWLNESFADYLAYRATAEATVHTTAWTTFLMRRKAWGYRTDQLSTTHPVAGQVHDTAEALLNFDGISYAKGASLVRQLVEWVGDEAFVDALGQHFAEHAYGNATLDDLVGALTRVSGRDVATWAQQWLRTTGVSTLSLDVDVDAAGRFARFAVAQRALTQLRPHRVQIGLYDVQPDTSLCRRRALRVDVAAQPRTDVPELSGEPLPDLVLLNDGDLTYALLDLDARSLATVRTHLTGLVDPLARALVWTALWEMVSQGRLAPSAYVRLAVRALGPLDPDVVLQPALDCAITAARLWAAPANRPELVSVLAEYTRTSAERAEPGSDTQLLLVRALVEINQDAQSLRAVLTDVGLPDGLVVDRDLRWRAVQRLAILGEADESDVLAECERDPSSSGVLQALTARTAMPTAQAKDDAWAQALGGDLSNHELLAIGQGFWHGEQELLLEPYAARFARDFPTLPGRASPQTTQTFGRLLFPSVRIDPATVELADAVLADPRLDVGARRVVAEQRDVVQRALRARAADPTG